MKTIKALFKFFYFAWATIGLLAVTGLFTIAIIQWDMVVRDGRSHGYWPLTLAFFERFVPDKPRPAVVPTILVKPLVVADFPNLLEANANADNPAESPGQETAKLELKWVVKFAANVNGVKYLAVCSKEMNGKLVELTNLIFLSKGPLDEQWRAFIPRDKWRCFEIHNNGQALSRARSIGIILNDPKNTRVIMPAAGS